MGSLRLAVVSASGSGRKRTIPALVDSDLVEVTAVHGRDQAKTEELAASFGIPHAYSDLGALAGSGNFDAVMICSPPFLHLEQARPFIEQGVPVLLEKPSAHTAADGQAIADLASSSGATVRIAHHLRHQPSFTTIQRWLQEGAIGQPRTARFEWSFRMNHDAPSAAWKLNPALNGPTALTDAGVHCVDAAIGLFGDGEVLGRSESGDPSVETAETCVILSQHGGVTVTVVASREYGPFKNDLLIQGTDGYISGPDFFTEKSSDVVTLVRADGTEETVSRGDNPYKAEVEDFARTVAGEAGNPGTTPQEAAAALRIIDSGR
jgi:predicted dehydrogenase